MFKTNRFRISSHTLGPRDRHGDLIFKGCSDSLLRRQVYIENTIYKLSTCKSRFCNHGVGIGDNSSSMRIIVLSIVLQLIACKLFK